jgi:YfiH family protein
VGFQRVTLKKRFTTPCYIGGLKNPQSFKLISNAGLEWLECRRLARVPWLLHAFSTRRGGFSKPPAAGLNLGFVETDRRALVERNRLQFFKAIGAERFAPAGLRQIHSAAVYRVERSADRGLLYRPCGLDASSPAGRTPPAADALLTDQPGVLLGVRIADCLPVILVDPRRRAIAAVHAGWRGALQRVIEKAVGGMRQEFGSDPGRMAAILGPSIRACCYAVGQEVLEAFSGRFVDGERFFRPPPPDDPSQSLSARYPMLFLSPHPPGHEPNPAAAAHLDLVAVAQDQLRRAGLRPANIFVAPFCTACRTDLFFSHRKEGAGTGRAMAAIGIRPEASRRKVATARKS